MGGYLRNYRLQPTLGPWQGPGKNHAVAKTLPFWFNFHLCENLDERCRRSERSCQSCGGPPLVGCHGWKYMSLLPHTQVVADKPLNKTGSCSDEWPAAAVCLILKPRHCTVFLHLTSWWKTQHKYYKKWKDSRAYAPQYAPGSMHQIVCTNHSMHRALRDKNTTLSLSASHVALGSSLKDMGEGAEAK